MNIIHVASVPSLMLAMIAIGPAAETSPGLPLRAADGTVVALWRKTPHPNKPYIAQLFAPGEKTVPLLDDSPADHTCLAGIAAVWSNSNPSIAKEPPNPEKHEFQH